MTKADKSGKKATSSPAGEQTAQTPETRPTEAEAAETEAAETEAAGTESAPADDGNAQGTDEDRVFKPLDKDDKGNTEVSTRDLEMVMDIPVKLNVQLGRTRVTIKQLLELTEGSVVELDGLAGDPMDIFINDYLVAQGEVVVVDDKYGIRITEIISPSERIHKLNR